MIGMAVLQYGNLRIDPNERKVYVNEQVVELTTMEFNIGPVDKCQKTAETRSGPGRIGNMQIEKDGACHPFKV